MKKTLLLCSLLIALLPAKLQAQNKKYARQIVDTLCSEAFYGRGYVKGGDRLASEYIARQYAQGGLQVLETLSSYYQPFEFSVNTQPGKLSLKINGQELTPGKDYLLDPASPSASGKYKVTPLSVKQLLDREKLGKVIGNAKNHYLLIDTQQAEDLSKDQKKRYRETLTALKYSPDLPIAGTLLLTNKKLSWHGSSMQFEKPVFTIKKEALKSTPEQIKLKIKSHFHQRYESRNVIGYLPGRSDSLLVFSAHYDHLGMMGQETMFPGANDNASGVALMLNLAQDYGRLSAEQRSYSMLFIAFSGEELGLLGSQYFTQNPPVALQKIKFLLNMDISGTGDEGIQVVNGSVFKKEFEMLRQINREKELLPQVKIRGEACNSDHCMFYKEGVPCFFIYTLGGIEAYHDIYDKAETLPLSRYEDYYQLLKAFCDRI